LFTHLLPWIKLQANNAMFPFFGLKISLLFFALFTSVAWGEGQIQFKADRYQRDLQTNTVKGNGHAWLKGEGREISADNIEFDFTTKRAIANGNVHIKETAMEMWASHMTYALSGEEATLEDAVIINGKLLMTGKVIRKSKFIEYDIEEGSYSNCNITLTSKPEVQQCPFDWKLYGAHFHIVNEGYAHVEDALVHIKGLPAFYAPYFLFPVKNARQTGVLGPSYSYFESLGSGLTLPYFVALGPWHDLTIVPTYYTKVGGHVGAFYRYVYSPKLYGRANAFFLQRRFGSMPTPYPDDKSKTRTLGLFGEWSVDLYNRYQFGKRAQALQILRLVSDPYYTVDHAMDLGVSDGFPYLRSQASLSLPSDHWFASAAVNFHQNLVISRDNAVDRGSVVQLPTLNLSRINSPLLGQYLSYEFDSTFTHFYRPRAYDNVPDTPVLVGTQSDNDPGFDGNDYLRTGSRLHLEPRLVGQIPIAPGIQFQPVLKAGSLLYHFNTPSSNVLHRTYLEGELPISLYFTRNFETGIPEFETIRHVFQPRVIYATRPYQSEEKNHPFFFRRGDDGPKLAQSNPRFDMIDQVTPFEYMRFELINRVLRKVDGRASRFFSLQVSEQLNLKTSQFDPRYQTRLGPLEIYSEASLWRLTAGFQSFIGLEDKIPGVRESDWSTSLSYTGEMRDVVQLSNRFVTRADSNLNQQSLYLTFYKRLPIFFDLGGSMEYSIRHKRFVSYKTSFFLEAKPRSCWGLQLDVGRDSNERPFVQVDFNIDLGNPNGTKPF